MKIKFASNNVICVFHEFEKIKVHIANIDLRTNRLYTTVDGMKYLNNSFLQNHNPLYFEEEIIENSEYKLNEDIYFNSKKSNRDLPKFNVCFDFKKDEVNDVIRMCS